MLQLLERTEELLKGIEKQKLHYCLCHADIHAGNIFISENAEWYIVDWDTLIFAPKERDLMFIGAGVAGKWNTKEEENYFYYGYGGRECVDQKIIDYYRCARIIEDIVEFYDLFFKEGTQEKNQRTILEIVGSMFDERGVWDMAFR